MNPEIPYRGTFRGGDPRKFIPDTDACTPEQIENWKAFCRIWNAAESAGDTLPPEPMQDSPENSAFGIGYQGTIEIEARDEATDFQNRSDIFIPPQNATPDEIGEAIAAWMKKRSQ